jgi:hypothetical protein
MWPRGCTSCWWMCTTKTRVMPSIPTKSDACTSTSWPRATFLRLSHARAKSEFLTLSNWDQPAKRDNPDRKHWSSRITGGWAWGWQPHPGKKSHGRTNLRRKWRWIEKTGGSSWRRPGPTQGCRANDDDVRVSFWAGSFTRTLSAETK